MDARRTWRLDEPITPVTHAVSVAQYGEDQLEQEVTRLRTLPDGRADGQLTEAANAWRSAREKLEEAQDVLRRAGEVLAPAWSSRASVACQRALMLIHDAAGDLAGTAHRVSDHTGASAQLMRQMLDTAPSEEDPGPAESFAGEVGSTYGRASPLGLVPGLESSTLSGLGRSIYEVPGGTVDRVAGAFGIGSDRAAEYQAALERLNQGYVAENWRMPTRITAELPLIGDQGFETRGDLPGAPGSGGPAAPGLGSGGSTGGSRSSGSDSVPLAGRDRHGGLVSPGGQDPPAVEPAPADGPASATGELSPDGAGLAGIGAGSVTGGAAYPGPGIGSGGVAPGNVPTAGEPSGGAVGGVRPGAGAGAGIVSTGSGGTGRQTGGRPGTPSGAGRSGAAGGTSGTDIPGRAAGGRAGAGTMLPAGAAAGGRGDGDERASHDTWLMEDDSPFTVDEVEDPPGVIR